MVEKVSLFVTISFIALMSRCIWAFKVQQSGKMQRVKLSMSLNSPNSEPQSVKSRIQSNFRYGISKFGPLAFSVAGFGLLNNQPAVADSIEDANNKLASYGFPPILYVADGFRPVVSEYGRGNNEQAMSNPILVQFTYPSSWVVQKTSVNNNGEAGTISANGNLQLYYF
jgi:hypothetical protein